MTSIPWHIFGHEELSLVLGRGRRTQNGIVLNMQIRQDNNLALFSNPLRTMPFYIL